MALRRRLQQAPLNMRWPRVLGKEVVKAGEAFVTNEKGKDGDERKHN